MSIHDYLDNPSDYPYNPWLTPKQVDFLAQHLRESAKLEYERRLGLNALGPEHRHAVERAVTNALSTPDALRTFAQIIDGLPIADVAYDAKAPDINDWHPADKHEVLCPGCMDKARELQKAWDFSALRFKREHRGLQVFHIRLLEMVAVAVHQFGAMVFKAGYKLHQGGDVDTIANTRDPDYPELPPPPSLFKHYGYRDADVYPDGAADVVGYWAENCILGGVTVFDRRRDAKDPENPRNAYMFPDRHESNSRICQLLDAQQSALLDFLLAESPAPESSPLPIVLGDRDYRNYVQINFYTAVFAQCIYRDLWERKPYDCFKLSTYRRRPNQESDQPEGTSFWYSNLHSLQYCKMSGEEYEPLGPPPHPTEENVERERRREERGRRW